MKEQDLDQILFPSEAANFLGISVQELARLRREKRVQGEKLPGNRNLTVYRLSQLRSAELTKERGRKRKKAIS